MTNPSPWASAPRDARVPGWLFHADTAERLAWLCLDVGNPDVPRPARAPRLRRPWAGPTASRSASPTSTARWRCAIRRAPTPGNLARPTDTKAPGIDAHRWARRPGESHGTPRAGADAPAYLISER